MAEKPDLLAQLAAKFPKKIESSLSKGGVKLTYIPVSSVIARANEVLGFDWSYQVMSTHRDDDWIIAHVRVTVTNGEARTPSLSKSATSRHSDSDGGCSMRDGFGGQQIKHTRAGAILDLGHEYKGAVSDALKKALQAFGVALYLASDESLESTFDTAAGPERGVPSPPSTSGPAATPSEEGVGDELKKLAARAKDMGVTPAGLRSVASEVLDRPVKKASDIKTHAEIEAINASFDTLEELAAAPKENGQ